MIVLTSVIAGVVAIILNNSVGNGIVKQMLDNQINLHTGFIQIHSQGFSDNKDLVNTISNADKIEEILKSNSEITAYSKRIIAFGLINSANSSAGVNIIGIEPNKESKVTIIKKSILEGNYPRVGKRDVLIGKKMAEKLEVDIGDKIVAVSNSVDGTVNNELFRVCGIYCAGNSEFENTNIFIPFDFAAGLLGLEKSFHEFVIITKSADNVDDVKKEISKYIGKDYEVLTYRELLPLIVSYIEAYKSTIIIFYIIIGLAVLFGIVNTMLMSVMERIQEFGVLMAVGMKIKSIFAMVVLESLVIGIIGSIIGFSIGIVIYMIINSTGIDLRAFSESLNNLGLNAMIYPQIDLQLVINSMLVMPITSVIGSLYPAYKATKLMPTDAMRYV
jgi:ABC-type lipoprotein release transport system permease subunit